jgi:hypothetical protein
MADIPRNYTGYVYVRAADRTQPEFLCQARSRFNPPLLARSTLRFHLHVDIHAVRCACIAAGLGIFFGLVIYRCKSFFSIYASSLLERAKLVRYVADLSLGGTARSRTLRSLSKVQGHIASIVLNRGAREPTSCTARTDLDKECILQALQEAHYSRYIVLRTASFSEFVEQQLPKKIKVKLFQQQKRKQQRLQPLFYNAVPAGFVWKSIARDCCRAKRAKTWFSIVCDLVWHIH